jgi:hypothetical protein
VVNISNDILPAPLSVQLNQIFIHPHHNVVLERSFDHLMEEIRRQELVNVGTWETVCEWLSRCVQGEEGTFRRYTYHYICPNTEVGPQRSGIPVINEKFGLHLTP